MGSVESNLFPGEEVRYRAKRHWAAFEFNPKAVLLLLILIIFGGMWGKKPGPTEMVLLVILLGGPLFLWPILQQRATEIVVTSKRIIAKSGILARKSFEINLSKVETVIVDQSVTGRILGYGTVTIVGSGGTREVLKSLDDPLKFRKAFMESNA